MGCDGCGVTLWTDVKDFPGIRLVPVGTFDDTSWVKPVTHCWTRSKQPWVTIPEDATAYETQPQDVLELLQLWQEARARASQPAR